MTRTPFVALPDTLSDAIEFDHPFTVSEPDPSDGSAMITDAPDSTPYAPDVFDVRTMADWQRNSGASTWELITGYSGQYSYSGPIMHDSEYLGGGMARDVLAEPGTYVVVAAYYGCTDTEHANGDPVTDDDPRLAYTDKAGETVTYVDHDQCETVGEGWALARLRDDCADCPTGTHAGPHFPAYVAEPDGDTWRVREAGTANIARRGMTEEAARAFADA